MAKVMIEYDSEARATYVRLVDEAPRGVRPVEIVEGHIVVDVDESGHPIGVEILEPPTEVTADELKAIGDRFPDLAGELAHALAGAGYRAA